jgi:NADH-quinone oxidoreductase subunit K
MLPLFIIFAATAIVAALGVVVSRKPIYSALFLLVNFGTLAALYIMLRAQFLAMVQVITYAGAIVVLFLFVTMLIGGGELGDIRPGSGTPTSGGAWLRNCHRATEHCSGQRHSLRERQRASDRPGPLHRLPDTVRAHVCLAVDRHDRGDCPGTPAGVRAFMIPTTYYLILSAILFVIGGLGVLVRRNVLIIFMCVEMMLNAVNLTFVALAYHFLQINGQIFVLMAMVVAATEVAVGLAIVMTVVRHKDTTNIEDINLLKG